MNSNTNDFFTVNNAFFDHSLFDEPLTPPPMDFPLFNLDDDLVEEIPVTLDTQLNPIEQSFCDVPSKTLSPKQSFPDSPSISDCSSPNSFPELPPNLNMKVPSLEGLPPQIASWLSTFADKANNLMAEAAMMRAENARLVAQLEATKNKLPPAPCQPEQDLVLELKGVLSQWHRRVRHPSITVTLRPRFPQATPPKWDRRDHTVRLCISDSAGNSLTSEQTRNLIWRQIFTDLHPKDDDKYGQVLQGRIDCLKFTQATRSFGSHVLLHAQLADPEHPLSKVTQSSRHRIHIRSRKLRNGSPLEECELEDMLSSVAGFNQKQVAKFAAKGYCTVGDLMKVDLPPIESTTSYLVLQRAFDLTPRRAKDVERQIRCLQEQFAPQYA